MVKEDGEYMEKNEFYKIYLPALEKALDNETESDIKEPEFYIENHDISKQISDYLESNFDDTFLNRVAYYYDSKAHNFPNIEGIDIKQYRSNIVNYIPVLKKYYKIL